MVQGHGRKPSSPFTSNTHRYRNVPNRAKSGGLCPLILLLLLILPITPLVAIGGLIVQHV